MGRHPKAFTKAALRRSISAKTACPSAVNEYGASRFITAFFTNCFRLRYCISAFIDLCSMPSFSVKSLMRIAPASAMQQSTSRTRSDSTGKRGAGALWVSLAELGMAQARGCNAKDLLSFQSIKGFNKT